MTLTRIRVVVGAAMVAAVAIASTTLRAPDAGHPTRWIEPGSGIEFRLVRPDTFTMGTPPTEPLREAQEVPHAVHLTKAFYLGRFELTQAQWTRAMGANPSAFADCGPSCPVERISLLDVERLLTRLNATATPGFRLPTEAEWELACRAGGSAPFGAAASLSSADANIDGAFPYDAPVAPSRGRTAPVGSYKPNAWGFFDMSGNVWEWVQDWYCLYPDRAVTDPVGQCSSQYRVIRGGSWKFDGGSARCGLRYTHRPQDSGYSLGVRLAHDVP